MAHTVDETAVIVRLLAHDLRQIVGYLIVVFPVLHVLFDFALHGQDLVVCATVLAALERADGRRVRRVRVGIGRRQHARCERGVVTAAVLGVQAQHDVEHARFLRREMAIGTQHGQNGLGRRLARNKAVHDHGLVVEARAFGVVREHHDARQTRNERKSRRDLVVERAVFGIGVIAVEQQDRTRKHVHDVRRRVAHDHGRRKAVGQLTEAVDNGNELAQLLLRGQFAHQQQVRDLFVCKTPVKRCALQQVADAVAAEREHAFVRTLVSFGKHVAVHVGDIRHACDDARSVGVAQAALHAILLIERRIDGVDLGKPVEQVDFLFQRHTQPLFPCV